jgi:uncharacterized membrane protein YbaN (DUF454 family)
MPQDPTLHPTGVRLWAWRIAGLISLALGVIGIFLPLLPTTPLLLLAAYCFGRGSETLLRWLLEHPRLGPPIRDWREHRTISRKAKALAAVAMALVIVVSIITSVPRWVLIAQVVVLALASTFIFTRPSSSRRTD